MTIADKIKNDLAQFAEENPKLFEAARDLNRKFDELIESVKDHLGEISREMPEYDKHDASHSEAVLRIIEELLQEKGIETLSLLEAMVLRFCCYFHDTGMILPKFCMPLLAKVEADPKADPLDGLEEWLDSQDKDFEQVKALFLIPGSQEKYEDFLYHELMEYQKYRLGLKPAPETMTQRNYIMTTRHDYLRRNHGSRSNEYAQNLSRQFEDIIHGSEEKLAENIGRICAAHGWQFEEVRKLPVKLELFTNCPALSCNVRYLAMLLRMGDLLHFGPERASRTLYIEREKMDAESDLHWQAKRDTRGYRINPAAGGGVDISYHGSFSKPREYYFVQEHMNWVDEELSCYESFRRDMEKGHGEERFDLGLPEKTNREHATARDFTPDRELKFKLEHKNIIQLLMGTRLYRDEFMCLRELYQNALDACRCMRAELKGNRELEIEFGLGSDEDGDYLYCRDQGTGMTMDIVKNYLLRIGNSYYQSDEFRRQNAGWGDAVAPVSEFGIGLLSCYMIADRIEIITRHHTAPEGEKPIRISMRDNDDFGYQRPAGLRQTRQLGKHGTIVKLYLKEEFKAKTTDYLPESPEDDLYEHEMVKQLLSAVHPGVDASDDHAVCAAIGIPYETMQRISRYSFSLYSRIQQFVRIPEQGIPVYICGADKRRAVLVDSQKPYDLSEKMRRLIGDGFKGTDLLRIDWGSNSSIVMHSKDSDLSGVKINDEVTRWAEQMKSFQCKVTHTAQKAEASIVMNLPVAGDPGVDDKLCALFSIIDDPIGGANRWGNRKVYIDGMGVSVPSESNLENSAISYNYYGTVRPSLTVDRGDIKSIPDAVFELERELHGMLLDEAVRRIEAHFRTYPAAVTARNQKYIDHYLRRKFDFGSYFYIMSQLSRSVFRDYRVYGMEWDDLLNHGGNICITADELCRNRGDRLIYPILAEADHIAVDGVEITVSRNARINGGWNSGIKACGDSRLLIVADQWQGVYAQYDVVNALCPLIPRRVAEKYSAGGGGYASEGRLLKTSGYRGLAELARRGVVNPSTRMAGLSDVILMLSEQPDKRLIHRGDVKIPEGENERRYILYAFLRPRPLTERDKELVSRYDHIPQYLEGVEKGWSVLFYNYQNGYVIAPGVVDRMEMLKLLPREALEHDDGLQYYFTDDTFAF